MSSIAHIHRRTTWNLPRLLADLQFNAPQMTRTGLLLLLAAFPLVFALLLDERQVLGVNVWMKPLKFAIALAAYTLTLSFYARFTPAQIRSDRRFSSYMLVVEAAILLEMVWLISAAVLGVPSHFNTSDRLFAAIYPVMGVMAIVLTSASAVFAVLIYRNRSLTLAPVLKSGLVLGLGLTLPLTLLSAGTMSGMSGHAIGTTDETGLPFFGWLRNGGDLRVAHFFATHALHFIPAFALLLVWVGKPSVIATRIFAVLFSGFVAAVFAQATLGQPFLAFLR